MSVPDSTSTAAKPSQHIGEPAAHRPTGSSPSGLSADNATSAVSPGTVAPTKPDLSNDLLANRWVILGMLFGVTGVLGLPALWISRGFTPKEKFIWSIINTIYTAALVGITWAIVAWALRVVAEYS